VSVGNNRPVPLSPNAAASGAVTQPLASPRAPDRLQKTQFRVVKSRSFRQMHEF
jgi:hypothetical protein